MDQCQQGAACAVAAVRLGGPTVGQVVRRAWPPMMVLAGVALAMLLFAKQLAGILT